MTETTKQVCIEALSLPKKARADLARCLLASSVKEPVTSEIEEAWKAVAEQRFAKLKLGRTTERDAKQAVRDARKKVTRSRRWHTCTAIRTIGRND